MDISKNLHGQEPSESSLSPNAKAQSHNDKVQLLRIADNPQLMKELIAISCLAVKAYESYLLDSRNHMHLASAMQDLLSFLHVHKIDDVVVPSSLRTVEGQFGTGISDSLFQSRIRSLIQQEFNRKRSA